MGELAPGAGDDAGLGVLKIACKPRRRARPLHRFPGPAAVGCLEDAGRKLLAAVAEQKPGLLIEKANLVESGHRIGQEPLPGDAGIVGEQNHADAAAALQFFPPRDPADAAKRQNKVYGPQRGSHASRLPIP